MGSEMCIRDRGATDEQLDFPVVYASGINGYAGLDESVREGDMTPLFKTIIDKVQAPDVDADGPFQMQRSPWHQPHRCK